MKKKKEIKNFNTPTVGVTITQRLGLTFFNLGGPLTLNLVMLSLINLM